MADGIKYDGSNKKIVFTVNDNETAYISGSSLVIDTALVKTSGSLILQNNAASSSSDIAVKVGTAVADGSVNINTKLLSIRTGINGAESEKTYIRKDGGAVFGSIYIGPWIYNNIPTFGLLNDGANIGLGNAGTGIYLGWNPGNTLAYSLNNFQVGSNLYVGGSEIYGTNLGGSAQPLRLLSGVGTNALDKAVIVATTVTASALNTSARILSLATGYGTDNQEQFGFYSNGRLLGSSSLSLVGQNGTGSTEVVTKVGTAISDASVDTQAKLLSVRTGLGSSETEYFYVTKNQTVLTGSLLTTGSQFSVIGTTRSNIKVINNNLDIIVTGSNVTGTQALIDVTNTSGNSQFVAQAQTYALVQAGTSSAYPYYLLADSTNKFIALESDENSGTIYLGGTGYASAINIGSAGSRNISIGNTSGSTTVTIKGGTSGTFITGSLTVTGAVEVKDYLKLSSQSVLPVGSLGMLAVSGSNLYFYDGSSWRQVSLV